MAALACACGEERPPYYEPHKEARDARAEDDGSPTAPSDASIGRPADWVLPAEPVSLEAFLDAHIDKVCAWVKRCHGLESCEGAPDRLEQPRHMRRVIPPEVAAGRLAYDSEEGLRCLQTRVGCDDPTAFSIVCGPVFRGRVALGGDCYHPAGQFECAEGGCLGASCPGQCKLPAMPNEDGEACSPRTCKLGSVCGVRDGEGPVTCGPERAEGESCDASTVCREGLHCSNGRCAEHIAHGAKCVHDHECAPTDVCRPYDGVLVCLTVVPRSSSCSAGQTVCEHGSTCISSGGRPGTCIESVGLGQSCARAACRSGLRCDRQRDVCVTSGNLGDECTTVCDFPLRCIDGVCQSGADLGESCASPASCRADLYCDSDGVCREPGGAWADCDPDADDSCDSLQVACLPKPGADAGTEYACRPQCEGPDSAAPPDETR